MRRPTDADEYAGGQGGWPPSQPADPHAAGYAPHGMGPPQHSQGYYFPQADGDPNHGYAAQPVSQPLPFDRLPPSAQPQGHWDGQHPRDAGHYDLGSYLPAGADPHGYGPADPPPFAQSPDGPFRHQAFSDTDGDYDALPDEEGDEPRRGRRGLVIAGALVGAIGLGGAMAYTYKTFIAAPTRAPVVKVTDAGPTKVKPSLSGGKEFAHTDKKLLNRLDEEGASQRSAAADDRANEDPNAPRRVRSIPISPAGQMAAAGAGPAAPVPGITLDNVAAPAPAPPQRVQIPSAPPAQVSASRSENAVSAPPPVRVVAAAPAAPAVAAEAAAPAPRRAPAAAPAREPQPKSPPAMVTASTSGYVAVLSSQRSRMDALKAFADLQQKYGDVLSSKTPDVQEANLGDKGVWYRAVVGPPVSRDAASGICSQLKAAGYAGCWVTAY